MNEQRNSMDPGLFLKEAIAPEVIAFNQAVEETPAAFMVLILSTLLLYQSGRVNGLRHSF